MSIISPDAAASTVCPPGCAGHLDGDVHISTEQTVVTSAGGERGEVYVSLEQVDGRPPAVRLQGAGDRPMSAAQALQLAQALTVHAFTAATAWTVTG